jgi:hypothetical protein
MLTRSFIVTVQAETPIQAETAENRIWDALQHLPLQFTVTQQASGARVGEDWLHDSARTPVDHGEQ